MNNGGRNRPSPITMASFDQKAVICDNDRPVMKIIIGDHGPLDKFKSRKSKTTKVLVSECCSGPKIVPSVALRTFG